jgi:long-chain acyl-CoA synthetase
MSGTPSREPVPSRPLTYLETNAQTRGEHPAVVEGEREQTFRELLDTVRRAMTLLGEHGIGAGDVVAVALPNVFAYVALEIAIPALGAVLMPLPPGLGAHELSSALERSGAVLAITAGEEDLAHEVAKRASAVREVLTVPLPACSESVDLRVEPHPTQRDDVVQIALTSGTTGPPKLAAFTAELKQVTFESFTGRLEIVESDRVLPLSPITQGAGEMFLYSLRRGAALVMLGPSHFAADVGLEVIVRSRATVIGGVPTMLSRMLNCPAIAETDFSHIRLTATAGAPLVPELAQAWEERTGAPVASFYGAMDIGQLAVPRPGDPQEKRWHTVGRPHVRAEWAILTPDGRPCSPGSEGEICMRGPLVQKRYWDQEGGPYAEDGWAHFGDLGFVDEEGYLHVTGRVKDTIIRGGNNINPYEIEEILQAHPALAEVAIVGRPDADLGERAVAFVVLRDGERLEDVSELTSFLDARGVARYKWPEALHELDELPHGPTGKLLRRNLRERAAASA